MKQPARDDESVLDFGQYMGDVHSHSTWSDGKATMLEMARGAEAMGYTYLGVTDHSPRIKVVNGLDANRLLAQSREMAEVQAQVPGVSLLQGIEVDIRQDGSLDLPVIGHPTGRRPGSREGANYDFEAVFKEAAKHHVALEIDCDPARMDLSPEMARLALELGCTFSLDADAHAPAEFAYVPMGMWMARRAGIPQDRILNFKPLEDLTPFAK